MMLDKYTLNFGPILSPTTKGLEANATTKVKGLIPHSTLSELFYPTKLFLRR